MSERERITIEVLRLIDQRVPYGEIKRRLDLVSRSAVAGIVYRARHPQPKKDRPEKQYGKTVHMGVNPQLFDKLKKTAVEWDCTMSELCRVLLTCAIEDQEEDDE